LIKLSWLKLENNQITDYTPIDFYHEVIPEDWEVGWN
jgi:hypothetical protein